MPDRAFAGPWIAIALCFTAAPLAADDAARAAGPPTTAPAPAASAFLADPADVLRRVDAGDRGVVPTLLHWLGAEQDRTRVGAGSPRLRVAVYGVERLRVAEAVPYLLAVYEAVTAEPGLKNRVALAAIAIAPAHSTAFLREVIARPHVPQGSYERSAQFAAAAALVATGEDAGRQLLLEAYRGLLETMPLRDQGQQAAAARSRRQVMNAGVAADLVRLSDPKLRDALAALAEEYAHPDQREHIDTVVEQMRANGLPVDDLFRIADDPPTPGETPEAMKAVDAYLRALVALRRHDGPDILRRLLALERRVRAAGEAPGAGMGAATTRQAPTTGPATRPSPFGLVATPTTPAALRAGALEVLADAIRGLRARHPIVDDADPAGPEAPRLATGPATSPAAAFPVLDEDFLRRAQPRRLLGLGTFSVGGQGVAHVGLTDLAGHAPPTRLRVDAEAAGRLQKLPAEAVVLVTTSEDGQDAERIEPIDVAPGEATPDGYVFVESRRVRSGEWEHLAAVLRKYGRETIARVPNRTAADGSTVSDRRLARALESLRPGEVVEASLADVAGLTMLTSIASYEPSLPAQFVSLTEVERDGRRRPAVELEVARERRTLLLPDADDAQGPPPPGMAPDELAALRPGSRVRFVPGASPDAPLRRLWADGYVTRTGGSGGTPAGVMAAGGRASYQATFAGEGLRGAVMLGSYDADATWLKSGIAQLVGGGQPAPKELAPERMALLRGAPKSHAGGTPADKADCERLMKRWLATGDRAERERCEQGMYRILQGVSAGVDEGDRKLVEWARATLTPAEYEAVIEVARGNPRPRLRPTTRPGKQPGPPWPAPPNPVQP